MKALFKIKFYSKKLKTLGVYTKTWKFVLGAVILAAIDASGIGTSFNLQPVANFFSSIMPSWLIAIIPLNTANNVYQTLLMVGCIGFTLWALYDVDWSRARNALNVIMAIPNAVLMDFISASISLRWLAVPLPPADYTWRTWSFAGTAYSNISGWINQPSQLLPGLIQGYNLGVFITIAFISIQLLLYLRKSNSGFYKEYRKLSA